MAQEYATYEPIIRRWIIALVNYHFKIEHRPRTQHRNADGLSKGTNDYKKREALLGLQPAVEDKWNFLSQEEIDQFPTAPWFVMDGKIIPNHSHLTQYTTNLTNETAKNTLRRAKRIKPNQKAEKGERAPRALLPPLPESTLNKHGDYYPDYPED